MSKRQDDLEVELVRESGQNVRWQPRPAEPLFVVGKVGQAGVPLAIYLHLRAVEAVLGSVPQGRRIEIGGLLVGQPCNDEKGAYLVVSGAIPAELAAGRRLCVTFTHQAWNAMLQARDRHFPQERIVGWYHTHPGLGVFLSGPDLFIHRHFFNQPWQVALVVDPDDFTWGMFCWHEGKLQAASSLYVYGEPAGEYERLVMLLRRYADNRIVEA